MKYLEQFRQFKERFDLKIEPESECEAYWSHKIIEVVDKGNGMEDVYIANMDTLDVNELLVDYNIDNLPTEDRDYYLNYKYLERGFPIDLYNFDEAIKADNFEKEFDNQGRLLKLSDCNSDACQTNTFDDKGNLISSVLEVPMFKKIKNYYSYDDKGRMINHKKRSYVKKFYLESESSVKYYDAERYSIKENDMEKILTYWDEDFKNPLLVISFDPNTKVISEVSEYSYNDNVKTIDILC